MELDEKVDIIIPVLNGESFLDECLKSVFSQLYENVNVIIVDDGSTDDTLNIIKKYEKFNKFDLIIHNYPEGVSKSRNEAMRLAKGKFITFVDADDTISSNHINLMIEYLNNTKNNIPVVCLNRNEKKVGTSVTDAHSFDLNDSVKQTIGFGLIQGYACGKLYQRELIINNKIWFDERLEVCEDLDFNIRYVLYTKNTYTLIRTSTYFYRSRATNLATSKHRLSAEVKAYKKISKFIYGFNNDLFDDYISMKILYVLNDYLYIFGDPKGLVSQLSEYSYYMHKYFNKLVRSDFFSFHYKVKFVIKLVIGKLKGYKIS